MNEPDFLMKIVALVIEHPFGSIIALIILLLLLLFKYPEIIKSLTTTFFRNKAGQKKAPGQEHVPEKKDDHLKMNAMNQKCTMENDILTEFINVDLSTVREIKIFAHTGRLLIQEFLVLLERDRERYDEKDPLKIKVLLKDPFSESPSRRDAIKSTYDSLERIDLNRTDISVEVRFYSAMQHLRGAIVQYRDGKKDYFCSSYNWVGLAPNEMAIKTTSCPSGMRWNGNCSDIKSEHNPFCVSNFENWFDYFWGPGNIHTIAFDFDDTILNTFQDHVNAWIEAVHYFFPTKYEKMHPGIVEAVRSKDPNDLKNLIESLIINNESADDIAQIIINDNEDAANINSYRQEKRMAWMLAGDNIFRSKLLQHEIPNAADMMIKLCKAKYVVQIASLTNEVNIGRVAKELSNQKGDKLFTHVSSIIGRSDYNQRDRYCSFDKSYLLMKAAQLSGIPNYRLAYIGDHKVDKKACDETGTMFIEARVVNRDARLRDENGHLNKIYFDNYNDLREKIAEIEIFSKKIQEDKMRSITKMRMYESV